MKEWPRNLLMIGMYFSCAMLAISIVFIFIEYRKLGYIPIRFLLIVPVFLFIIGLTAYFSHESAWSTLIRLFVYVLTLISIIIGIYGLRVVLSLLLGDPANGTMTQGLIALIGGGLAYFGLMKLLNSKWI